MLVLWRVGLKAQIIAHDLFKSFLVPPSNKSQVLIFKDSGEICSDQEQQHFRADVYEYKPLPHNFIRLLILYSGKPKDPLRGYLITKRFYKTSNQNPYEALSYVWGDSAHHQSMILNNQHFDINQNLYAALHHLRSRTANRTLWIDAICINQADESERDRQVSLMGDIYACAENVVNWLGLSTPNTALGLKTLAFLFGDKDISHGKTPWENHKPSVLRASLQDILQRDYFERIWVVQENALASRITLQLGSETLTWNSGAETHRAICRIKFAVISPSWEAAGLRDIDVRPLLEILEQNMMVTRRKMGKSCREVTILDQAFDMRYRRATDRRDMLFALRGMVPEEMRENLVVNYKKSVDELYAEFFKEVEKAYMGEMEFVRVSEKKRLDKILEIERLNKEKSEKRQRSYGGGW